MRISVTWSHIQIVCCVKSVCVWGFCLFKNQYPLVVEVPQTGWFVYWRAIPPSLIRRTNVVSRCVPGAKRKDEDEDKDIKHRLLCASPPSSASALHHALHFPLGSALHRRTRTPVDPVSGESLSVTGERVDVRWRCLAAPALLPCQRRLAATSEERADTSEVSSTLQQLCLHWQRVWVVLFISLFVFLFFPLEKQTMPKAGYPGILSDWSYKCCCLNTDNPQQSTSPYVNSWVSKLGFHTKKKNPVY